MVLLILSILLILVYSIYNFKKQDKLAEVLRSDIPIAARNRILQTTSTRLPENGQINLITTADGIIIRTIRWMPNNPNRGTILLCQGYSEFIEKYDETIKQLLDKGFAVLTFDWRGQGLSSRLLKDPQKAHSVEFADFIRDVESVYQQLLVSMPKPFFIIGHSMGGHLAFRLLQEHPKWFKKAVLCAPLFGWARNFGPGNLNWNIVLIVASLMKMVGLGQSYVLGTGPPTLGKQLNGQTSDIQRYQKRLAFYQIEPYILMGGPTWNWLLACTKSLQVILQDHRIAQIETPILLASGAKDGMVSPESHHQIAPKSDKITLYDFPEAMHEILMERDAIQNEFWQVFDDFIRC